MAVQSPHLSPQMLSRAFSNVEAKGVDGQADDEDLKLARQLQEQERAYFLLAGLGLAGQGGGGGSVSGLQTSEREARSGSCTPTNLSPQRSAGETVEAFDDDEAFARALQEEEQRMVMARLIAAQMGMAGFEDEAHGEGSATAEDDTDPDNMTYEQLTALGEVVGREQRGVSKDAFAALDEVTFKATAGATEEEQCVICRVEFEEGDTLKALPCKHHYHPDCIQQWLNINKNCPMCSKEVCIGEEAS